MNIKLNEFLKELYHEKLELAKGERSINQFAKDANISPGNVWKMLGGQIAKPETLRRIAEARPDLDYLYEELMYAAGYAVEIPKTLKSDTYDAFSISDTTIPVPIIEELQGVKSKIFTNMDNKKYYYPKECLEDGKYFFFSMNDHGLSPQIHEKDLILFDMTKTPQDGDIVLFRINKTEALIRFYRKQNAKIIAYSCNTDFHPDYFNKNDFEIFGVAVSAVISFKKN